MTYKLAVNHFADMSDEEMRMRRGRLQSTGYNGGLPFQKNDYNLDKVPDELDWRFLGEFSKLKVVYSSQDAMEHEQFERADRIWAT